MNRNNFLNKIKKNLFKKELIFVYILSLGVILLSFLKIHGSSIAEYNLYFFGKNYKDNNLIFGNSRSARSDEWLVATPFILSQVKNNFKHFNPFFGNGQEMSILYDAPTDHWSTFFKPYNWIFFVLPIENAFAFKWWFRGVFLMIAVYLFVLLLIKNDIFVAIFTSLIIFFSPFTQWWYSTGQIEVITYGLFIPIFLIQALRSKTFLNYLILTLFFTYFLTAFILILYPPFQIAVAWFILLFTLGYLFNKRIFLKQKELKKLIISGIIASLCVAVIVGLYFYNFKDIIFLISHSSYPGSRSYTGGHFPVLQLFYGFFNLQGLNDKKGFALNLNQSEASSYIMLFPFIFPLIIFQIINTFIYKKRKRLNYVFLNLIIYLFFTSLWLFYALPTFLAKITLFELVEEKRMIIGIGIVNIILMVYYLTNIKIKTTWYKIISFIFSLTAFLTIFFIGLYLKNTYPIFIQSIIKIIIIASIAFFLTYFLLNQHKKIFLLLLLGFVIVSSYKVNPFYNGLSPILNTKFSKYIQAIESQNRKNKKWIVYDNLILGNYIAANGGNVFNGVHMYSQPSIWGRLDPQKKYYSIYNRYSHIIVRNKERQMPNFKLIQNDIFEFNVDPCDPSLNAFNIGYYVFPYQIKSSNCLHQINKIVFPNIQLYIYNKVTL